MKNKQTPHLTNDKKWSFLRIMEALCLVSCPLLTSSGKDTHLWNDNHEGMVWILWGDRKY